MGYFRGGPMLPLYDRNPTKNKPVVTRALIYSNAVVFMVTAWLASRISWIDAGYGLVPSRLAADPIGESFKILTSMFLHGGFIHLAWNMLFLHIFGDNVEDALGRVRYLLLFVVSGTAGALAHHMGGPSSSIPLIGASGAIAGILGSYLVLYPRAPITVLNVFILPLPILVLPAWIVVGLWFVTNLVQGLLYVDGNSGVAHLAHLGGFVAGLLFTRPLAGDDPVTQGEWSGWRPPPRQTKKSVFPGRDKGPFWRD